MTTRTVPPQTLPLRFSKRLDDSGLKSLLYVSIDVEIIFKRTGNSLWEPSLKGEMDYFVGEHQ